MSQPTVLVVGSGRCGTSAVGRVCHEELGICFGHFLKGADYQAPKGYYEDLISHALVRGMADASSIYSGHLYLTLMSHFHKDCLAWGAKDPWFLYLTDERLKEIKPKLGVVCVRKLEDTVKSWIKLWELKNPTKAVTQEVVDGYAKFSQDRQQRALQLGDVWPNIIVLDFTQKIRDADIVSKVRNGLASASHLF